MTPLALGAARPKLTLDQLAPAFQLSQHRGWIDSIPSSQLIRGERPVGLRVAPGDQAKRVWNILQEGAGKPARRGHAERIPVCTSVGRVDESLLARQSHLYRAALGDQRLEHCLGVET